MIRLAAIAGLALVAQACMLDGGDEPAETLLVPAQVELHWSGAFNAQDDGLGAVVPVDVMVYDSLSGEPREGVLIELSAPADTFVLTEGELVRVDPDVCVDCALFWDAFRDQYYALQVDLADVGTTRVRTDDEGLARVFVLVDAFDGDGGGFAPVSVQVSTEVADATVLLVPR